MKTAITYIVLSLVNLIAFVIGVLVLPAQVPIHFNVHMVADVVGSPWVYVALPAAAAFISVALFIMFFSKKVRSRILLYGLVAVGGILCVIGWVFFALAASGVQVGEKTDFPVMLSVILPLSLFVLFGGGCLSRVEYRSRLGIRTRATLKSEIVWTKTHRLGGSLIFLSGLLSAVCAIVFTCAAGDFDFIALIVFPSTVLVSAIAAIVYAGALSKREKSDFAKD